MMNNKSNHMCKPTIVESSLRIGWNEYTEISLRITSDNKGPFNNKQTQLTYLLRSILFSLEMLIASWNSIQKTWKRLFLLLG